MYWTVSNRTFEEFVYVRTGKEIYDEKYNLNSGSKANRMRAFWEIESNYIVGKLLGDIFDEWDEYKGLNNTDVPNEEVLKIIQRLKSSAPVPNIDAVIPNSEEKDVETLAKAVRVVRPENSHQYPPAGDAELTPPTANSR